MKISAAVTRGKGEPFAIEVLDLESPRPDEILVKTVGVGLCHTDLKVRDGARPVPFPIVLGHEGSGIVAEVGSGVTTVRPGDPVVLTFNSCGACRYCRAGRPAYCRHVIQLSFGGARRDGSLTLRQGTKAVHGSFFGQSSFASYALANERNVVKVPADVPLELLGPLGCGIQTGAGAVLNSLAVEAGSSIAVFGVGPVGLSAVMAAAVAGCSQILAVDTQLQRLEVARELGATDVVHSTEKRDLIESILAIVASGVDYALDTTSNPGVFRQAVSCLGTLGTCGLIGGMSPGTEVCIEANHLLIGRSVRGIIQGDSVPGIFIPRLIELYRQGRFPFDRLVSFYPFEEINTAALEMAAGQAIKPILRFG